MNRIYRYTRLIALILFSFNQNNIFADENQSNASIDIPRVSPDGQKLAFISDDVTRHPTVWLANRNGSNAHPLLNFSTGFGRGGPDWLADSKTVLFTSKKGSTQNNIWSINVETGQMTQLTTEGGESPKVSPDGKTVLFESNRNGQFAYWFMNPDGSNQRISKLIAETTQDPAWSPDGKMLVYSFCYQNDKSSPPIDMCNLMSYEFQLGAMRNIIYDGDQRLRNYIKPDWGSQGITFESNNQIWVVGSDGKNLRQLTQDNSDHDPHWDRTNDTIVFSRTGNQSTNIWQVDLNGNLTQLTHLGKNQKPIARVGADRTVRQGSIAELDGSNSYDPDSRVTRLTYEWIPTDENPVVLPINDGSAMKPKVTMSTPGVYRFALEVKDGFWTSENKAVTTLTVPMLGDLDGDRDVDLDDLALITAAKNQLANGPNDVRDINGDLKIDMLDARKATQICTRTNCAR